MSAVLVDGPSSNVPLHPPAVFRVLFVCTGNVCRSTFAEFLARQLIADRLGSAGLRRFIFSSAGVRASTGSPMHPNTRMALAAWATPVDARADAFVSRQLDEEMVANADLVLTAEESQRSAVVWLTPDAFPRVYNMRRFARIVAAVDQHGLPLDPVQRARKIMERAPRLQASLRPAPAREEAIPDPIGGGRPEHLLAADLVFDVVAALIDVVAPAGLAQFRNMDHD